MITWAPGTRARCRLPSRPRERICASSTKACRHSWSSDRRRTSSLASYTKPCRTPRVRSLRSRLLGTARSCLRFSFRLWRRHHLDNIHRPPPLRFPVLGQSPLRLFLLACLFDQLGHVGLRCRLDGGLVLAREQTDVAAGELEGAQFIVELELARPLRVAIGVDERLVFHPLDRGHDAGRGALGRNELAGR